MKIVVISNKFTLHQLPWCDALVEGGNELRFIEADNLRNDEIPSGSRELRPRDYVVSYDYLISHCEEIDKILLEADAVVMGGDRTDLTAGRLKRGLLTFEYCERIYKRPKDYMKLPYHLIKYRKRYNRYPNLYLLCASAFTYSDFRRLCCFRKKAYKWGYFTVVSRFDIGERFEASQDVSKVRILWVARFLPWKHPEIAVVAAKQLKERGIDFELNMYGTGPEHDKIAALIAQLDLGNEVHLCGNKPNTEIHKEMRSHDIFLFTSDRNEGWGAVLNEAMSNGCAVVASHRIGSVPYLVRDGENGLVFRSEDVASLTEKILFLINNPEERKRLATNAYGDMLREWSPQKAAENFLRLADDLRHGRESSIRSGPCSKAY